MISNSYLHWEEALLVRSYSHTREPWNLQLVSVLVKKVGLNIGCGGHVVLSDIKSFLLGSFLNETLNGEGSSVREMSNHNFNASLHYR
jgi:hypothetical protein